MNSNGSRWPEEHVAQSEQQIAKQKVRIRRLQALHAETGQAEHLLGQAEELLELLNDSLSVLRWHRKMMAKNVEAMMEHATALPIRALGSFRPASRIGSERPDPAWSGFPNFPNPS